MLKDVRMLQCTGVVFIAGGLRMNFRTFLLGVFALVFLPASVFAALPSVTTYCGGDGRLKCEDAILGVQETECERASAGGLLNEQGYGYSCTYTCQEVPKTQVCVGNVLLDCNPSRANVTWIDDDIQAFHFFSTSKAGCQKIKAEKGCKKESFNNGRAPCERCLDCLAKVTPAVDY